MDTRELPPETILPGHQYSIGEMRETIALMRKLNSEIYNAMFWSGIGARCHAFIEFCGLQAKYIDICEAALAQGLEFPFSNGHGAPTHLDEHHARYLGEKFGCIFSSVIDDPKLCAAFLEAARRA